MGGLVDLVGEISHRDRVTDGNAAITLIIILRIEIHRTDASDHQLLLRDSLSTLAANLQVGKWTRMARPEVLAQCRITLQ